MLPDVDAVFHAEGRASELQLVASLKSLEERALLARLCWSILGSGDAATVSYDRVFDIAFWEVANLMEVDASPAGANALRDLEAFAHPQGGSALRFQEARERQGRLRRNARAQ